MINKLDERDSNLIKVVVLAITMTRCVADEPVLWIKLGQCYINQHALSIDD